VKVFNLPIQVAITHHRRMLNTLLSAAKTAARPLAVANRNALLSAIAAALEAHRALIHSANNADVQAARASGMSDALLDRLALTPARLDSIIAGVLDVVNLPDPLSHVLDHWQHPNGMQIRKRSVPFGVIGVIYESRPNVTVDAAALCLKAGSAVVLRGSSNALASNRALSHAMRSGLEGIGADPNAITFVDSAERSDVTEMLNARGKIDLLIPRGGAALIKHVIEHARVPVIETGTGVCHLYVHASADIDQALAILLNGKVQRPGVCNSLETLLVDAAVAPQFLPRAFAALAQAGVDIRACALSQRYGPNAKLATDADYASEFLALIIAVKVVPDFEAALAHIAQFSTQHSEVICASDPGAIQQFCDQVDAACVYANASTRFSDGFEFGFGAEIGISTQKMHARGPMGLREMVTYKYVINGSGQVR
jgi:glutamate-5-semialdehyde dehydrogenase